METPAFIPRVGMPRTPPLPIEQMLVRWTDRPDLTTLTPPLPNRTLDQAIKDLCLNVQDFGAVPDGTILGPGGNTDNTAAIQRAIYALEGKKGGGLFFPEGCYRVNAPVLDMA